MLLFFNHLDYANCLYSGLPNYFINQLQRVHNAAVRSLLDVPSIYTIHVTPLLRQVHWLSITYRIRVKILKRVP